MQRARSAATAASSGPATLAELARLEPEQALAALQASLSGLSWQEAARRRQRVGENSVAAERRAGPLRQFLGALLRPLPLVLLALAVVNGLTGQLAAGAVIAAIVLLSTALSFLQEYRSDQAAARLRAMVHTKVLVRRCEGGVSHEAELPPAQLVPGDIVCLAAGDAVPADLRILHSRDLFVDQSTLTGEALPVEKFAAAAAATAGAFDLPGIAFMGSSVTSGTATAVVAATGSRTDFGQIAAQAAAARVPTSFDRGLQRFIGLMLRLMLAMMLLVFLLNGLLKGDWLQAFQFGIAIAVGLAPELLPAVVTVNLAKGALAMAERKCIVKRLNAIQNIGAMDVLCTDKTGTLTQNRIILARHVDIDGRQSAEVTSYAYLNSHFQTGLRSLLDHAVLEFAAAHQQVPALDYRKIDELPFDFTRRRMSVILQRPDGSRLLVCKGAVEEVLDGCVQAQREAGPAPLESHHGAALGAVVDDLNREGFRVIAVAWRELPAGQASHSNADESGMTLAGYIAFLDPPKSSAQRAIQALTAQGIAVKVLSGDNEAVTRYVAHHVGFQDFTVLSGPEIARMDAVTLAERAAGASLFVKLTPQQKVDVIRALQQRGHAVGFLGDGINDAGALKAADVGISVDTAADIAKESADIILLRQSLMVLSEGVHEGRRVFANISKYLRMSASSNFGNMLSVLGASAFLPFLPMAPVQILLNNLLYDVSQTALASDHVDRELLARPRRWDMADIGRALLVLGPASSLFDYLTFAVLWYGLHAPPAAFQTGWFLESLLTQTLVVHVIRTRARPFLDSAPSPLLLATTLLICACGLLLPVSPLGPALGMTPMPPAWWWLLPALVAAYLGLVQWLKRFSFRASAPAARE